MHIFDWIQDIGTGIFSGIIVGTIAKLVGATIGWCFVFGIVMFILVLLNTPDRDDF